MRTGHYNIIVKRSIVEILDSTRDKPPIRQIKKKKGKAANKKKINSGFVTCI